MSSLNDKVRDAVVRLQELKEPCHNPGYGGSATNILCPGCQRPISSKPQQVQPHIVNLVIKALTKPCVWDNQAILRLHSCGNDDCPGYQPRDWDEIGEYALWGVLVGVVANNSELQGYLASQQHPDNRYHYTRQQIDATFNEWVAETKDTQYLGQVALTAVVHALEQMYGH